MKSQNCFKVYLLPPFLDLRISQIWALSVGCPLTFLTHKPGLKIATIYQLSHHIFIINFVIMPLNFQGSANYASVLGMKEHRGPTDPLAPTVPIHTVTSFRTSLLPLSCCIAGGNIPVRRRKAAALELLYTTAEPNA